MADKSIAIRFSADTGSYTSQMEKAARATERAAKDLEKAQDRQEAATKRVEAAEKSLAGARAQSNVRATQVKAAEDKLAQAKDSVRAAAEKVGAAELSLNQTRAKGEASAREVLAAEKNLATAKDGLVKASADQVNAENKLGTTRAQAEQTTVRLERAEKNLADAAGKQSKAQTDLASASVRAAGDVDKLGTAVQGAEKSALSAATGLNKAGSSMSGFGKNLDKTLRSIDDQSASIDRLSNAAGGLGLALAVPVGLAVKTVAEFDQQMSAVAATGSDARASLDGLREAAIEAGADTAYSAKEAAQGMEELLKAGVSAQDVMGGGLSGALSLAAAGQLEVGEAAEIAATAMTQFNLSGRDVPHIADLLAAGAGKAQGEVADLGNALTYAGKPAADLGVSIEETSGTLALFAKNGLIGEQAGTSFRSMLMSMTAPSTAAEKAMDAYGISVFNAQGKFIGMSGVADVLQEKLSGLTDAERQAALGRIFGNEAIQASLVLMRSGAEGVQEMTDAVNDAGYAAITAAEKQNNLAGDIEKLGGSIDTVFLKSGSGANDVLRSLAQSAEGAVDWIGTLDSSVLSTGLSVAALGSGALLAVGGLGKLAVGGAELYTSWKDLSSEGNVLAGRMGKVTKAAAAGALGLGAYSMAVTALLDGFRDDSIVDGMDSIVASMVKISNVGPDAGNALDDLFKQGKPGEEARAIAGGVDDLDSALRRAFRPVAAEQIANVGEEFVTLFGTLGDTNLDRVNEQLDRIDDGLSTLAASDPEAAGRVFTEIARQANELGISVEEVAGRLPAYRAQLEQVADTLGQTVSEDEYVRWMGGEVPESIRVAGAASTELTADQSALAGQMEDTTEAAQAQREEFEKSYTGALAMSDAISSYEQALADASETIKTNGENTSQSTIAGRENIGALNDQAREAHGLAEAMAEAGEGQDAVRAKMEAAREEFIKNAEAAGFNSDEAERLADSYGLIPSDIATSLSLTGDQAAKDKINSVLDAAREKIVTTVEANTAEAQRKVEDYHRVADALNKVVKTKATAETGEAQQATQSLMDQYQQLPEEEKTEIIARANDADLTISEYLEKLKGIPADQPTDIVLRGVPEAKESVWDWVKNLFGARDSTQTAATDMTNALTGSLNTTSSAFATKGDQIGSSWAGDMRYVRDQTDDKMTSARNINRDRLESMSGKFDSSGRGIRNSWWDDMKSVADTTWSRTESARNAVRDRMDQMSDKTDKSGRSMRNSWSDDLKSMQDRTWDRTASARNAVRDRMNQMSDKTDSAGRSMRQGWSSDLADMRDNTSGYARDMEDRIGDMASRVVRSARGIRGAMRAVGGTYNNIAEVANTRKISISKASGGGIKLPGFSPGVDDYHFYDPVRNIELNLGGGEFINRPEVAAVLGHDLDRLNAAARQGGIAGVKKALGGLGSFTQRNYATGGQFNLGTESHSFARGGLVSFKGKTFTARFAQVLAMAERIAGTNMHISQGGFRPATSYSGSSHAGDAVDITRSNFPPLINALRSLGVAAWLRNPSQGNWPYHIHGIPGPSAGRPGGSGVSQWASYVNGGNGLGGRDDWNYRGPKGGGNFNFDNLPSVGDIGKLMEWSMNGVRKEFDGDIAKIKDLPDDNLFDRAGKKLAESLIDGLIDRAEDGLKEVMPGFAAGGRVWGAGTSTSDSIMAKLSRGEWVMPTQSVDYYGAPVMEALQLRKIDRQAIAEIAMPHMRDGGIVEGRYIRDTSYMRPQVTVVTQEPAPRPPANVTINQINPVQEKDSTQLNRAANKLTTLGQTL
ncbi:phage tail tape measure protein [Naumannella halotolerans]|uniref:TP901 family phage tail tape measure protein n=1 Tax=Naumannella halotolerans TaxID=993414 RepID=A0A4R7J3L0_9ACTN|nr:phage tail tape measure protein [Naumannella halotolerans]TDT31096.1 TP901 family phage tail tape measure protein [Naumannella halotolerans]